VVSRASLDTAVKKKIPSSFRGLEHPIIQHVVQCCTTQLSRLQEYQGKKCSSRRGPRKSHCRGMSNEEVRHLSIVENLLSFLQGLNEGLPWPAEGGTYSCCQDGDHVTIRRNNPEDHDLKVMGNLNA